MSRVEILTGDCLEVLPTLPASSVQTVMTSPPYWGLRDYGTAEWEGGDAECDHQGPPKASERSGLKNDGRPNPGRKEYEMSAVVPFRETCGKCGARRLDRQLGLESTPEEYVEKLVTVFREVRRVLRDDGTLWLNLGDSYAAGGMGRRDMDSIPRPRGGHRTDPGYYAGRAAPDGLKPKDLVGIPWRVAFALQADGWYLRSDIVWSKPNPMPESVMDRPTKSHEYLFLLAKGPHYFYDADAIREPYNPASLGRYESPMPDTGTILGARQPGRAWDPGLVENLQPNPLGRNRRSVWTITTHPFPEAHFATFPEDLVVPCVLAGTSERGCCAECGAPMERVVEKSKYEPPEGVRFVDASRGDKTRKLSGAAYNDSVRVLAESWEPTCSCTATTMKPCTVLDPFAGAGTVGVVCSKHGRDFVGVELNPEYAEMARRRCMNAPLSLFAV